MLIIVVGAQMGARLTDDWAVNGTRDAIESHFGHLTSPQLLAPRNRVPQDAVDGIVPVVRAVHVPNADPRAARAVWESVGRHGAAVKANIVVAELLGVRVVLDGAEVRAGVDLGRDAKVGLWAAGVVEASLATELILAAGCRGKGRALRPRHGNQEGKRKACDGLHGVGRAQGICC